MGHVKVVVQQIFIPGKFSLFVLLNHVHCTGCSLKVALQQFLNYNIPLELVQNFSISPSLKGILCLETFWARGQLKQNTLSILVCFEAATVQ